MVYQNDDQIAQREIPAENITWLGVLPIPTKKITLVLESGEDRNFRVTIRTDANRRGLYREFDYNIPNECVPFAQVSIPYLLQEMRDDIPCKLDMICAHILAPFTKLLIEPAGNEADVQVTIKVKAYTSSMQLSLESLSGFMGESLSFS